MPFYDKIISIMKIIDTHCHVYPDKIAVRASSAIGTFYNEPICCDGMISTLLRESKTAGISRHVLSSVATTPHQVDSINRFIAESVQQNPDRFRGLGTIHPDSPDPADELTKIQDLGLKGIKIHPDFQSASVLDPRFLRIFELCEKRGLPVLCHCGDDRYAYSNPVQIKEILNRFPDLVLIGAHFGGWTVWKGAVAELFDQKKLYVDCSSSLYALGRAEATAFIRFFGAERVLFGVDYPMWSPSEEVERFNNLFLTTEEREQVLWKNAASLFGIQENELDG